MTRAEIEAKIRLRDEMSDALKKIQLSLGGVDDTTKKAHGSLKDISQKVSFKQLAGSIIGAQLAMEAFRGAARFVREEFGAMIEASSRAAEVNNLFEVSFGEMAGAAEDWAQRTQQAIGVNDTTLKEMSGTLFNMVTAMGISKDAAYDMATGMTELALDTSSFFNLPFDRAFTVIQAGLAGETEGLRRLGVDITETSLKQLDFVTAIEATGRELTQAEKVMARNIAIQQGLANAQGDLIRTQDSWANQTRLVTESWTDLREKIGLAITDSKAVAVVIGRIREVIIELTDSLDRNGDVWVKLISGGLIGFVDATSRVLQAGGYIIQLIGKIGLAGAQLIQSLIKVREWIIRAFTPEFLEDFALKIAGSGITEEINNMQLAFSEMAVESGKSMLVLGGELDVLAGDMARATSEQLAQYEATKTATQATRGLAEATKTATQATRDLAVNTDESEISLRDLEDATEAAYRAMYQHVDSITEASRAADPYQGHMAQMIAISEELVMTLVDTAREMTGMKADTETTGQAVSAVMWEMSDQVGGALGQAGQEAIRFMETLREMKNAGEMASSSLLFSFMGLAQSLGSIFGGGRGLQQLITDTVAEIGRLSAAGREVATAFSDIGFGALNTAADTFIQSISDAVSSATTSLGEYFAYISEQETLTAEQAQAAAAVMGTAFREALAETGNLVDAFAMLGPSFGESLQRLDQFQIPSVEGFADLYAFVQDNAGALGAIADLTAAMTELGNVGLLTAEDLASIGVAAEQEFRRLIESGAELPTVLAAIGPQLAALYAEYQRLGVDVPPWLEGIATDLEGMEPPRDTAQILGGIETAVLDLVAALREAFGLSEDLNTSLSQTLTPPSIPGGYPGGSPNAPGWQTAQGGMFEKLRKDTLILAHAGELVNIIPAAHAAGMAVRTAQAGIPKSLPEVGGTMPEVGGIPKVLPGIPKVLPDTGGGQPSQAFVAAVVSQVVQQIKPDVAVSAPANINVNLPELSARQWGNKIDDEILPRIRSAIRNNRQGIMSAIREQL